LIDFFIKNDPKKDGNKNQSIINKSSGIRPSTHYYHLATTTNNQSPIDSIKKKNIICIFEGYSFFNTKITIVIEALRRNPVIL
jgi:hypothetical protein